MPTISFDEESRIMNIKVSVKKSVDSDVYGNMVVDYDKNGQITNIDLMDFSMKEFHKAKSYANQLALVR